MNSIQWGETMKSNTNEIIDYITDNNYKQMKEEYNKAKAECALVYAMLIGSVLLNMVMIMDVYNV